MLECYIKSKYTVAEVPASNYGFCIQNRPSLSVADYKTTRTNILTRDGEQYKRYGLNDKELSVEFNALEDSNIKPQLREFVALLMDATEIRFSDENMTYLIKNVVIGKINNEFAQYASFTVSFTTHGYERSNTQMDFELTSGITQVFNYGTYRTWPNFEIKFPGDCGYVSLISPEGQMLIGNVDEPDKVFVGESEYLVDEEMHEIDDWQTLSYDNAQLVGFNPNAKMTYSGEFEHDQYGIMFKEIPYKDHTADMNTGDVRGQTIIRKLKPDLAGEDFAEDYEFWTKLRVESPQARPNNIPPDGTLIMMGVMDEDMKPIIHFGISGGTKSGLQASFTAFIENEEGELKRYAVNQNISQYRASAIVGSMKIVKRGNHFECVLVNERESGTEKQYLRGEVINNQMSSRRVGYIYLSMSQYDYFPLPQHNTVTMMRLKKYHPSPINDLKNVFMKDDVLKIDHQNGTILLNDFPYNDTVAVGSKFWSIPPGSMEITARYSEWAQRPHIQMSYHENWR